MASKKLKLDCWNETEKGQEAEKGNWDGLPQEVLNMILDDLPVADLLSCSNMSKNWKKASRDVLKRSRECYAHIKDFPQDVQDLNDIMASKDFTQMFNGLSIKIRPGDDDRSAAWQSEFSCSYAENMLKSKQTRQKMERAKRRLKAVLCGRWKYLNLDMGLVTSDWVVLSIDNALLLRELISATSESLQKLVAARDMDFYFISCCGRKFTKLQVLHTRDNDTIVGRYGAETFLEEFVLKFAPSLQEITGEMLVVEAHSPGNTFMLKRMKNIVVAPDLVFPEAGSMECFRCVSDLYRLNLQNHCSSNSDDIRTLFSMVLKSLKTLEELFIRTSELYNLVKTSDDIKLPNLRRLSLSLYAMPVEDEISVLRRLNLAKMCPNLEHLEFTLDEFRENYEEEDDYPLDGLHELDRSDLPLKIEFKCTEGSGQGWVRGRGWGKYNHEYLEFLSQIYPKIHKIKFLNWKSGYYSDIPNNIFSDHYALEYLEIDVSGGHFVSDVAGIAAILCGINVEEANFLFIGPPTTNSELHRCIVPTGPTIFNAKNLKELKFFCGGNRSEDCNSPSWVIRVTENLPVRHERELIVTFVGAEKVYCKLNDLPALKTLLCAQVKEN